ncbi:hemerythrin domain-containing protein [Catellatospora coxensis]|uniref:hemerythrin domain-containing protein n=1 Tax=Catellatospora coxensis TaxID=310354 RepID=UPI00194258BF|nr:hemerythrin domain-containing protein [Catellatospora coxensis]
MASPAGDRVVALSTQLAQAHQELRRRVREIRSGITRRDVGHDALVTHCLAFCAALTSHHRGEDAGMFAELLGERPDLAPTIAKLVEDHGLITSILSRVAELAGSPGGTPEEIGRELDGLTAIMESHFAYEERVLGEALDRGVADTGWADPVFRFRDHVG